MKEHYYYSIEEDEEAKDSTREPIEVYDGRSADFAENINDQEEIEGIRLRGRYTAKQSASLMGISRSTFHAAVKAGKIRQRHNGISPRPYYLGRDLLRLLNAI
ncbi:MAG: hypothetical protein K2M31_07755 [Muribaculaceae bacterium]|nr:hypothetical protein [Muribaculaceae bacterium]